MIRTHVVVSIALLGVAGSLHASVINVPVDQPTIQQAINAAVNGDEVIVAPGVWNQRIDFLGKAITVRSQNVHAPALTSINGGAGGTVVTFISGEGPSSKLAGFTLTNGLAPTGGGVFVGAGCSPTIEDCVIQNCQANNGGGVGVIGAVTLRNTRIIGNNANVNGGAIYGAPGSNLSLHACRLQGNGAPTGAAAAIQFATSMTCTEVFDNVGGNALSIMGLAPVSLINCNVIDHAMGGVVVSAGAVAPTTVANCIVRNNAVQIAGPAGAIQVRFSNVQGGFGGPGNIDVPPMYVNAAVQDFRLQAASMCIDAGENASVPAGVVEDFNRIVRLADRALTPDTGTGTAPIVDIGAHEFPPTRRYVNDNATGLDHGMSWGSAYLDLQDAIAEAALPASDIDEIWVAAGTYKPDGGTGNRALSFQMISDVDIVGGFNGTETDRSQNAPMTNLTILSGNIGNSGPADNSYHVVQAINVNSNSKLTGFVVQRGNANAGAPNERGAGVYVSGGAPVIRECWIRDNEAASAGGGLVTINSDCDVIRNRFDNNSAFFGGAVAFGGGSPRLLNCTIIGNHASFRGGGVYSETTSEITNCTILSNDAAQVGGGIFSIIAPDTTTNCILFGNTAPPAPSVFERQYASALGTIDYSCIQGWVAGGVGNFATAPLLVDADGPDNIPGTDDDNPRPTAASPCIDSADGNALPGFVTDDLDGNPRYTDDLVVANTGVGSPAYLDRGAFEYLRPVCEGDTNFDNVVSVTDLLAVINGWGACPQPCPPRCAADVSPSPTGDCAVNVIDLLSVINHWGGCP